MKLSLKRVLVGAFLDSEGDTDRYSDLAFHAPSHLAIGTLSRYAFETNSKQRFFFFSCIILKGNISNEQGLTFILSFGQQIFTEYVPRSWGTIGNKTERMPALKALLQKISSTTCCRKNEIGQDDEVGDLK